MNRTLTLLRAALVCCGIFFLTTSLSAADIKFKRLSVDQGLSQSTVFSIEQDHKQNIWMGTSDGLNKYDGYGFTVYRHITDDSTSLGDNTVNSLLVDHEGIIWIGTASGLSCYNYATGRFENFLLPGHQIQVYDIVETSDARELLLATDIGIVIFDKRQRRLEVKSYLTGIGALCLRQFKDGVLIGTNNGLYNYSSTYGTIVKILPQLEKYQISNIVYHPDRGCWIATHGNGLYRTDMELQITRHYNTANSSSRGLTSDNIRVLKADNAGQLWIGTFDGLFIYDGWKDSFDAYQYVDDDATSINHNSIRSIFMDNQGGMWLGTYYGGVSYYHPLAFKFGLIQHHASYNSLTDNTVSCIVEEKSTGNLWIGTNDSGLNYHNVSSGEFTQYQARENSSKSLRSNNIKCVLPEENGDIWIGTHAGGLSRMKKANKEITTYCIHTDNPINNSCYSLYKENERNMWVGTLNGLLSFDIHSGTFAQHRLALRNPRLGSSIINTLYHDSRSNVWIGTNSGLYCWSASSDQLDALDNLKSKTETTPKQIHVMCITEDSKGIMWIGTRQGMYKFDRASNAFINYTTDDGLPNNYVYGILEDELHRLWISTNKGLACFDPATETFRNYTKSDGISSNQFNLYSYCKSSKGIYYFGSINGITCFRPQNLVDNPFTPKAEIMGLTIFNQDLVQDKRTELFRDSMGTLTGARFPSKMNLFGVHFVVTNLLAGDRNQFAYMLEGFDNRWYYTRNREATYSNLSPGTYVFKVKACNNDGKWSDEPTTFNIRITPMWYQTFVAKILYLLAASAIAYLVIRFYTSRAKMRVQLYLERIEKRKIEEISQEKIRFYINMSHELRTPLTLILSPLQEMKAHGTQDKYMQTRLDYVYNNSNKLLHIVNQLLEYRKAELGMIKVTVAMCDVESIVANVFSMFEENAQNRDMDFILSSTLKNQQFPIDRLYIEMITTNLLSNAFKFTPNGGTIKVSLTTDNDKLVLSVRDSGIGIPEEKKNKIFERFYQVNEAHSGTGIGLSIVKRLVELHHGTIALETEPGQFTEFIITLPAYISAYAEDERAKEGEVRKSKLDDISLFIENSVTPAKEAQPAGLSQDKEESILIVEDNQQIKQYLADNFRDRYNIYTASDGEEALALLKTIEPNIIITDVMMPGMDGLKLCQTIKQNIRTSHIPVIILTAKDSLEDQISGIEAGADDYLSKPFSLPILNAKIANLRKARYRLLHYYSNSTEIEPDKITSNSIDGEFLKKAIKIVEDNMDNEEFSSNDFARELCMSRSNLHLKMKSITGESSTKFIRKIRFNYACKLLVEGKHSIAEISSMVGFNSPSYFATSFKKHMGCLPTEYVKNKRGSASSTPADESEPGKQE